MPRVIGALDAGEEDAAELVLRDRRSGDVVPLGRTGDGAFETRVAAGTYDLVLRSPGAHDGLVLRADLDPSALGGSLSLGDLADPSQHVDIEITVDGAPGSASLYDRGALYLRRVPSGPRVYVGSTRDGGVSVRLPAGSYDVEYRSQAAGGTTPSNPVARIAEAVPVSPSEPLTLDVPTVRVHGDITPFPLDLTSATWSGAILLDGGPFPASIYTWARLDVRDLASGASQQLARTNQPAFSVELLEGTYEVRYTHVEGEGIPPNRGARVVDPFALDGDRTQDIDVVTQALGGSFLFDGLPLASGGDASYSAIDRESGVRFALGRARDRSFAARVIEGSYELRYGWAEGDDLPRNEDARLGCVDVIRPR